MVTQLAVNGDAVSAAATFVQVSAPAGERWKSALATPDPPVSAEFAVTTDVPLMFAAAAGAVIDPEGAVLSTRTLAIAADVATLPPLSVATTRRS